MYSSDLNLTCFLPKLSKYSEDKDFLALNDSLDREYKINFHYLYNNYYHSLFGQYLFADHLVAK